MIFEFDFQKVDYQDPFTPKKVLLGGFIYAINKELKRMLEISRDINTIDVGDSTLLFKHGKYVFGILIVTEYTKLVIEQLNIFVEKFENSYEKELENWTGDLSVTTFEKIQSWVNEIFR